MGYIGKLYAIEREQRERSDAERYQARQVRSVPLLNEFKTWLEDNVGKVMKGSLTRRAMEYTLAQWPCLCSGQLNPDTWLGRSSAFAGAIPSLC